MGGDVLETDRTGVLADETDAADHETGQGETLGTSSGFEGLGGNDTLQGSVGEGEDDVEEVVEGDGGLAVGFVDVAGLGLLDQGLGDTGVDGHGDGAS